MGRYADALISAIISVVVAVAFILLPDMRLFSLDW